MRKLAWLAVLGLVACGGGAEGVRVGSASSANAKDRAPLKGKVVAENTTDDVTEDRSVESTALALPFPIDPIDGTASAAEVEKLKGGPLVVNWVPPGQAERWGHAQTLVRAPLEAVRAQATDYGHIKDVAPAKFKTSRIIDKHGATTDVYLQMPMMKGLIMLWEVVRFAPLEVIAPGHEVVQGALVKGNVKQCRIVVTMRAVDPKTTVLTCDLIMTPEFYAPQATIDEELRDGAHDAVEGLKDRAEKAYAR